MSSYDGSNSKLEVQPIAIFMTYLGICSVTTAAILRSIFLAYHRFPQTSRSKSSAAKLQIFAGLAALSLSVTWYYMLSFFAHSYHNWASHTKHRVPQDLWGVDSAFSSRHALKLLGAWLRESKLFKEAWETASNTSAKFWWTQPIFFVTTGWSLFLEQRGRYHGVPLLWAFMLLGQLVAVSFAMNLFYLAVLVNPTIDPSTNSKKERQGHAIPNVFLYGLLISATIAGIIMIPFATDSPSFLMVLSVPHVLLFIPPLFNLILPARLWTFFESQKAANESYKIMLVFVVVCGLLLQARATYLVSDTGFASTLRAFLQYLPWWKPHPRGRVQRIAEALYEHPAVSSVGFDSVLCLLSTSVWLVLGI